MLRRLFWAPHAMIMYGMLLLVTATIAAAVYKNVLGILSPYPLYSIPVLLGVIGGLLTFLGVLVVLQGYRGSEVELRVEEEKYLNLALIITIALPVITGLLTLTLRTTNLMGLIYTIHMGTVIGFFLYIPFSKLNHAIFRYLALAKYHSELLSHELGNKTH
jgi:citrate/tricarballylate utilization protein